MVRTKKQQQGDWAESEAIFDDLANDYEVRLKKKNNKGYDYERKKIDWNAGGIA